MEGEEGREVEMGKGNGVCLLVRYMDSYYGGVKSLWGRDRGNGDVCCS